MSKSQESVTLYERDYFEEYGSGSRCYEQRRDNPTFTRTLQEMRYLGYTSGYLLDVGCAYGLFLAQAKRTGFAVWGVDISEHAIEQARQYTNATLAVVDVASDPLPFEDNFLDVVTALDVLEHLENYHHALREIARVLRPGGLLAVLGPGFRRGLHEPTHRAYFTLESLHVVLAQHGFEILISGERGGRWNKVWGVLNLLRRRDRLFNFAWLGHGSFIVCYARKLTESMSEKCL